jgi:hypothetical protein
MTSRPFPLVLLPWPIRVSDLPFFESGSAVMPAHAGIHDLLPYGERKGRRGCPHARA